VDCSKPRISGRSKPTSGRGSIQTVLEWRFNLAFARPWRDTRRVNTEADLAAERVARVERESDALTSEQGMQKPRHWIPAKSMRE
jgi:hypothetical protein